MDNFPSSSLPPTPGFQPAPTRGWWARNWAWFVPTGCLTLLALPVVIFGGIVLFVFGALKASDAYHIAVQRAETNPQVISALGSPVEEGLFLSGNVNVNGASGNANLAIPVSGPKAKGKLHAVAEKSGGVWTYSKLDVQVDGTGETIDLLGPTP